MKTKQKEKICFTAEKEGILLKISSFDLLYFFRSAQLPFALRPNK
jgi:hypothetical protein